ncbi:hypothetical protein DITRI_Ditri08aG0148900 [Diplodiscus trichospermus]
MERQVAIIGAGISGLLACKYTLSKGFHPIVFESQSSIGGVWTKTFETTKLQTPKPRYQFSDFPWPSTVTEDFPNQRQVLDYVESYAKHFDLLRHIMFNTKVSGIEYEGFQDEIKAWSLWGGTGEPFSSKGKWKVIVEGLKIPSTEIYQVDFVIVCVGRFSGLPNIPEFPPNKGPEAFHGKVIHSMDYAAMDNEKAAEFIKGKRVIVVGFQKSALDIAMECSAANGVENPCTVFYRTPRWNLPHCLPWGFSLAYMYFSRFSQLMVHKPDEGPLLDLLATILAPLRWACSKFVETNVKRKLRLSKHGMVPEHSFHKEISSCSISTVPEKFYDRVEEGKIKLKKASSFSFCHNGVLVEGETTPIEADLVILATGFKGEKKLKDIFLSQTFQNAITGSPDDTFPLYRLIVFFPFLRESTYLDEFSLLGYTNNLSWQWCKIFKWIEWLISFLPLKSISPAKKKNEFSFSGLIRECIQPRIPQLAVIGFSDSISNLFASEMRCRWLAELLDGTFKLPSIKEMEKDVTKWDEYLKRYSDEYYRRKCIAALHIWYYDQLCKDMGWNPRRKKGFFAELFEPYGPLDYVS